ncbi:Putative fucose synthetase [Prochlorococcus marinus str. MIT 9515]|uniref:GDP-L-fucose synthase n=1 Tax=Prochlorococcus marinus (strain MIT 9515) TaxID=167542 RepID=A2BXR5_PROM5|nr:GDP-L-fucose synthase [Prochlorococcus marinus]ABM72576.1 Putative fucose synthetase [Prochlorococcus marinus str. MIT 9515]
MTLINKEEKIFIAGGSGMVGSAIIRKLNNLGFKHLIFPNSSELDLKDSNLVFNWFKKNKPDIVIFAAAKVGGIFANNTYPVDFLLDNLKIQNNVIESAWKNKVRRLLFLGSSCVYPKNSSQPINEDELLKSSLEKTNEWYALAKISGIKLCQALRKQYGFDAISLMPTNLYGKGDNYHSSNSHVLPALLDRFHSHKLEQKNYIECWGSGNPRREFMHVDDLADASIFALENWDPNKNDAPLDQSGEPLNWLNVGTGIDLSIKELAEMIASITSFKGKIIWNKDKPDGTFRKLLNVSKLEKLGWRSKISLEEGLLITYKDYKKELKENKLRIK